MRKAAGERLFGALCRFVEDVFASSPLALSYEIQEIDADLRWKQNNIRSYMEQREKGA